MRKDGRRVRKTDRGTEGGVEGGRQGGKERGEKAGREGGTRGDSARGVMLVTSQKVSVNPHCFVLGTLSFSRPKAHSAAPTTLCVA